MANPYIGEIRMFGGNFPPQDWAFCNGQVLQISDNPSLFQLLGTTYGGDGTSTFGLPNLQGRLPVDQGSGFSLGQSAGTETATLLSKQLPTHNHPFMGTTGPGNVRGPSNAVPATTSLAIYATPASTPNTGMDPRGIVQTGGDQSHPNMMPYLAVNFIISLYGIYPTQN